MAETELNLYQKLAKVRKNVEVVQKNKSGFSYKYVTDDELLSKITGSMDKLGISLVPKVVPGTFAVEPYTYTKIKKGVEEPVYEMLVHADMIFTWINNDNPTEFIDVPWALVGHQGDASQSFGSALTYSYRYFILKYFGVATPEDDPDNWRSKQKATELEENKMIAEEIIKGFDVTVRGYLAEHADKVDKVKTFISKYVKGGNYKNITEPTMATKLTEDFTKTFIEKE